MVGGKGKIIAENGGRTSRQAPIFAAVASWVSLSKQGQLEYEMGNVRFETAVMLVGRWVGPITTAWVGWGAWLSVLSLTARAAWV